MELIQNQILHSDFDRPHRKIHQKWQPVNFIELVKNQTKLKEKMET